MLPVSPELVPAIVKSPAVPIRNENPMLLVFAAMVTLVIADPAHAEPAKNVAPAGDDARLTSRAG
ncbi:hypothetical protein D3C83_233170 [compost metagenome]